MLDERVDKEEGSKVDSYTGREIKAFYENRWFLKTIKYSNKFLKEYYVVHKDDFEDHISPDDSDGVEVQLL